MNRRSKWTLAIILSAAAGLFALQNVRSPSEGITLPLKSVSDDFSTPSLTPAYEGCAYIWAHHDSPELTAKLDQAVRAIDPQASANVDLFGEDCVYADGHSTFSTMETNFYIRRQVNASASDEEFGNWMKQGMELVGKIPEEEIPGNTGFVEFWFTKNETETFNVRVPLQRYLSEAQGKSGAEVFRMFLEPEILPNPT